MHGLSFKIAIHKQKTGNNKTLQSNYNTILVMDILKRLNISLNSLTTEKVGFYFLCICPSHFMHLDKLQRKHMDSASEGSRVFKLKSVLVNASDSSSGND